MKKKNVYPEPDNNTEEIPDRPLTAGELIHKYGTYEIQPTAESENDFPMIAQGLSKHQDLQKLGRKSQFPKKGN